MKTRAAVLIVFTTLLSSFPLLAQLEDLYLILNDPSKPFVKVYSVIENGKPLLKLQNGFHETVQLKEVLLVSNGMRASLLEGPEKLLPADSRYFDVSSLLKRCFDMHITSRQEKLVKIQLEVVPEPKGQPAELIYRVCFEDGTFIEFEKSETEPS